MTVEYPERPIGSPLTSLPERCFTLVAGAKKPRRRFWRMVLRFLNFVEPGPEVVLSPTRIGMWIIIFVVPWITFHSPDNIAAVLTALGTAAPFVINYMHQRHCDRRDGDDENSFEPIHPPRPGPIPHPGPAVITD